MKQLPAVVGALPPQTQLLFRRYPYFAHPQGRQVLEGVRFLGLVQDVTGLGRGMRMVGQTNCGKTTLCIEILRQCPPSLSEAGWQHPVLYTSFRERSKLVDVYHAILNALGDPMAELGKVVEKKARCLRLLKAASVKLLIIDEPHHLTASATDGARTGLAELAKVLLDAGINVMFAGVRSIDDLTRLSPELARRFPTRFELTPYRLHKPEELTVLRNFCNALGTDASGPEPVALGTDNDFFVPLAATSAGAIGVIAGLVRLAKAKATFRGARRLTLQHFAEVWEQYLSDSDESHLQHLARKGKRLRNLFLDGQAAMEVFGQVAQTQHAYG